MTMLSREQMELLSTTQEIAIPQCGGATASIRTLSARERDKFDASLSVGVGEDRTMNLDNLRGRLLEMAVVEPRLTADEWGDAPSVVVGVVFEAVQKLNGMTPTAVDKAEKNSGSAPSAASSLG